MLGSGSCGKLVCLLVYTLPKVEHFLPSHCNASVSFVLLLGKILSILLFQCALKYIFMG